jgi:hypothetical protein
VAVVGPVVAAVAIAVAAAAAGRVAPPVVVRRADKTLS